MPEKVSIITPTYRREKFLPLAYQAVAAQTYKNVEWLVLDDSAAPSAYMQSVNDPRVRYCHSPQRMKIGRKRNELVAASTGSIIVHFDDDDYYAPSYIERMVARLDRGYDFVKLSGWYVYAVHYRKLGYWDTNKKTGRHYIWSPPKPIETCRYTPRNNERLRENHLFYGFSYVYRKDVWNKRPFSDDIHGGEDGPFAVGARETSRLTHFRDVRGCCLHILHAANTSRSFPQYVLPGFALRWIFPKAVESYIAE